jgi:hypothetical protein
VLHAYLITLKMIQLCHTCAGSAHSVSDIMSYWGSEFTPDHADKQEYPEMNEASWTQGSTQDVPDAIGQAVAGTVANHAEDKTGAEGFDEGKSCAAEDQFSGNTKSKASTSQQPVRATVCDCSVMCALVSDRKLSKAIQLCDCFVHVAGHGDSISLMPSTCNA